MSKKTIITNCEKATFLIEKQQMKRLSLIEAFQLKIHLSICATCRIYKKQSLLIDKIIHKIFRIPPTPGSQLDDAYKNRLQHRIEKEMRKK